MAASRALYTLTAFLIAALAAGLAWTALQIQDLRHDLADLTHKAARGDAPTPTRKETAAPSETAIPSGGGDVAALSARVDQLKRALDALSASVGQGDSVAPDVAPPPGGTPRLKAEAASPAIADALASLSPQQQEAFKAAVLQVIDDREKEQQAMRAMEKKNAILNMLAQKLGMTPTQRDNIQQIFNQATGKILQLRQSMNESNAEQVKTEINSTLQAADAAIRGQLTVEQTAQYEQWTQGEGRGIFGAAGAKPPKPGR